MKNAKIFLLDMYPSSDLGISVKRALESCSNFHIKYGNVHSTIHNNSRILSIISNYDPDLTGIVLPGYTPHIKEFINSLIDENPGLPIIIIIGNCKPEETNALLNLSIADFIAPPHKAADIISRINRIIDQKVNNQTLIQKLKEKLGLKQLVGETLDEIKNKLPVIAKCDVNVLITGETGTGKELVARAIHYLHPIRKKMPFVPVNCSAIPENLLESELFGHMRGSFTGAITSRAGLIEEAEGGSVFFDEIGDVSKYFQAKLLRFLQEKELRRVGSNKSKKIDVRILAATNNELERSLKEGDFRHDLYYRLNIIRLVLPPLRKRKKDIPALAHFFLTRFSSALNKQIADYTSGAMNKLIAYNWPGNVRELEAVIERAVVFSAGQVIRSNDLDIPESEAKKSRSFKEEKARAVACFEKKFIEEQLILHRGNITKAATSVDKNPRVFRGLIRKYGIDRALYM